MTKEETVNVTLTLFKSQVTYLDKKGEASDRKRSQVARAIIKKDMQADIKKRKEV